MLPVSHSYFRPFRRLVLLTLCLALLGASIPAPAQGLPGQPSLRVDFPVNSPGIPAYARLELLVPNFDVPNNKRWAAIVFYRDPACVPDDFDLGSFFHPPDPGSLGAFACPLLIEGHEIWENGPQEDLAPRFVYSGNAVPNLPVWFVSSHELEPQLATGRITITDLRNMKSLVRGEASWFEERLYPNGSAADPGISLRARGLLEDGRRFSLVWDYADFGDVDDVRISFSRRVFP